MPTRGRAPQVLQDVAPAAFELAVELSDEPRAAQACAQALIALRISGASGRTGRGLATLTPGGRLWVSRADRYSARGTRERALADFARASIERGDGRRVQARALYFRALEEARSARDPDSEAWVVGSILAYCNAPHDQSQRLALAKEFLSRHEGTRRTGPGSLTRAGGPLLVHANSPVGAIGAWTTARLLIGCYSVFLT